MAVLFRDNRGRNIDRRSRRSSRLASVAVALIGTYWLVERILVG